MIPRRGNSVASRDLRRVITVSACCLLAGLAPFIVGLSGALLGLVPLGFAIWLVMRSGWSSRTRVITTIAVLVLTVALRVSLLAVLTQYYNN